MERKESNKESRPAELEDNDDVHQGANSQFQRIRTDLAYTTNCWRAQRWESEKKESEDDSMTQFSSNLPASQWTQEHLNTLNIKEYEGETNHPILSFFTRRCHIPEISLLQTYLKTQSTKLAPESHDLLLSVIACIKQNASEDENDDKKPFIINNKSYWHSNEVQIRHTVDDDEWIPKLCQAVLDIHRYLATSTSIPAQEAYISFGHLLLSILPDFSIDLNPFTNLEEDREASEKNDKGIRKLQLDKGPIHSQELQSLTIICSLNPHGTPLSQPFYRMLTSMKSDTREDFCKLRTQMVHEVERSKMLLLRDKVYGAMRHIPVFGLLMVMTKVEVYALELGREMRGKAWVPSYSQYHLKTYDLQDCVQAVAFLGFLLKYKAWCEYLRRENVGRLKPKTKTTHSTGNPRAQSKSDGGDMLNGMRVQEALGTSTVPILLQTRRSGSTIWKTKSTLNGEPVVIKRMPRWAENIKELGTLLALQGVPGVVEIIQHNTDEIAVYDGRFHLASGSIYMMMPELVEPAFHSPQEIRNATVQLLQAVKEIHARGYIHGDIKPHNIGWHPKTGRYQLIDFGGAVQATPEERVRFTITTSGFRAPEMEESFERSGAYYGTSFVDEYALGVTLDRWMTEAPFVVSEDMCEIDLDVHYAVSSLLRQDDAERPSADQILESLFSSV